MMIMITMTTLLDYNYIRSKRLQMAVCYNFDNMLVALVKVVMSPLYALGVLLISFYFKPHS